MTCYFFIFLLKKKSSLTDSNSLNNNINSPHITRSGRVGICCMLGAADHAIYICVNTTIVCDFSQFSLKIYLFSTNFQ